MNKTTYRLMNVILILAFALVSYTSAKASSAVGVASLQASDTRMLIPLYSDPSAQWTSIINANVYKNIDVIINPVDGPGASIQNSYTNGIAQLRNAGVGVFGYIYTGYGTRSLSTVKAEVDMWKNWYGVDGIFFDEASNTSVNIPYYSDLQTYVTAKAMTSILNPGTNTIEAYMSVANTNIIYENDPSSALPLSTWASKYPASKFGALQYAANAAQMRMFVASAKARNIGYIFVTDDNLNNPWNQLPAYLAEEASLLASSTVTSTSPSTDTTGVFRPSNGMLYLKNSNTLGFADAAIGFGTAGDYPVAGDWDGNGTATFGIYHNGSFYLRNSNTIGVADFVFAFGQLGDQPIAGDWNGDGIDTIGVYRPSTGQFLLRNSNSGGAPDMNFYLGNVGDVGIAGDWNGDEIDTTGVFRPSNGVIFLKNTNSTGFADVALNYGLPGDQPVTGDWNGDGLDTIGVFRNGQFLLRNSNTIGFADLVFALGNPGDIPIVGNWDGLP